MADNTLQFETRVNLGGLNDGLEEATSSIENFSSSASSAMDDAAQATKRLADAQIQLGAAAEAGNAQAAAIIAEYQAQVDATTRSTQRLTLEQKRQYDDYVANAKIAAQAAADAAKESAAAQKAASDELTIAQKRQYEEYVAQQRAIIEADKSVLTSRMAIGAEARILEGSTQGATRAIAAYLSSFPALAAAAQAAFSAFALVAIAEIAVDVGKKLYDAFDMGGERARKFQQDLADVESQFNGVQANLDVRLQKLIAEKDKLEGKAASNGLALDLAEATQRALELDKVLDSINKHREDALKSNAPSLPQRALGTTGTHDESVMLEEHNRRMQEATSAQAQLNEQQSYGLALQTQLSAVQAKQEEANELAAGGGMLVNYGKQIEALQQLIHWREEDQKVIETTQKADTIQAQVNTIHETPKAPKDLSLNRVQLFIEENNQKLAIDRKFHEELEEGFTRDYNAQMESVRKGEELDRERTEMFKKDQADMREAADATAASQHQGNLGGIQTAQAKETSQYDTSLVKNPEAQLSALRDFHQQADQENIRFDQEEMAIYAGQEKEFKKYQDKMIEDSKKANLDMIEDSKKMALEIQLPVQKAYLSMENSINQMLSKTLSGQETWSKAAEQLYNKVADTFVTNVLKMAEQYLVGLMTQKAGALSAIEVDAKKAASGAYAATSDIPIVGPVLAPVAAAAAFGAVMAFGSFEQGGIVAGGHGMPVPIIAHAGERVLSAPQTQRFESLVNNGGSRSATLNQTNHFGGGVTTDMLQAHTQQTLAQMRGMVRPEALR